MRATVRAGSLRSFSLVQDEGLGWIQTPRNACISNRSRRRTRTSSSPRPHGCWRRKTAGSPASPCSAIGGTRRTMAAGRAPRASKKKSKGWPRETGKLVAPWLYVRFTLSFRDVLKR